MGKVRWEYVILAVFLVALFTFRMTISLSEEHLSYDSYLTLREVEHIQETFVPLREDSLSLLVPQRLGSPVHAYLMAMFALITPLMYKILPNLFMVLLLIPVYFLTKQLTNSKTASNTAVVLAGTGPMVLASYLNTPAVTTLAALVFLLIISFLHDPNTYLYWIIGLSILLVFLSPVSFLLALSFLAIILLLRLEGFGVDKKMNELFFFTLLLTVWFNVLIYKEALLLGGVRIFTQNLPSRYAALTFANATPLALLYGLGVVTFLFSVLGGFHALFESRDKNAFPVIGASLAVTVVTMLGLIELRVGIMLLAILLAILAGYGLWITINYIRKTRAPWVVYVFGSVVTLLFLFSGLLPALGNTQQAMVNTISDDEVNALTALSDAVPVSAILLTTPEEAWAVQYFGNRMTLVDKDFLLVKRPDELLQDIDEVYTSRFTTGVVNRADKWGFTHILFSTKAQSQYNREELLIRDTTCFSTIPLYKSTHAYAVRCTGDVR